MAAEQMYIGSSNFILTSTLCSTSLNALINYETVFSILYTRMTIIKQWDIDHINFDSVSGAEGLIKQPKCLLSRIVDLPKRISNWSGNMEARACLPISTSCFRSLTVQDVLSALILGRDECQQWFFQQSIGVKYFHKSKPSCWGHPWKVSGTTLLK